MRRAEILVGLALVALLTVATPAAARQTRLVVGFSGVKQLTYAAMLIALERARDRGYEVVPVFFPRPELAVQALLRGETDLARIEPSSVSVAIARGAGLAIVGAAATSQWVLVSPRSVTAPAQLARRRVAVHSVASMSNTVVQYAIKKYKIAQPQILIIPGSPARAQALMQGEIDATSLFLTDAIRIEQLAPGRFHVLVDFREMPMVDSVIVARRDWIPGHREEIEDVLRGLLETHRRIAAGPEWGAARTRQLFPDEDAAFVSAVVRAYIARGVWDQNGGIDHLTAAGRMVRFLKEIEALPAGAPDGAASYVELGPLQDVLKRIGRK
jgi:ABC-type nitrate/sulfonate/bicarbonate transport system substrate-binding protein